MAVKLCCADGNLTTGATWATVDATALLDSEVANSALTTSYVESAAFTPGAITIDGIAVKVATRAASPTGTISIRLATGGVLVAGTEVTINVSDIASRDGEQGWYLFKFAAPVLLIAATNYTVSAKTSSASQVNLYRNATAGNWSRLLRTTTTGAPGAGDSFHICAEYTAAATRTTRTVTMDSTAATDYGNGTAISTSNPANFTINNGGTLVYGTTAATNYILRLSSTLVVNIGGTLTIGSTGTPMPRDSTAVLEFDNTGTDGDFGLEVFGTWTAQGQSRTSGKNVSQCLLNTDEAAGQTTIGVDTDTGWLNGDEVALGSTTRTAGNAESKVLNGNATATTFDITVATANARSGTSPTQCEVILLTRNVIVRSVSTTVMGYVHIDNAAVVDCDWIFIRYMGSTTTGKRGVEIETTVAAGGSCAFDHCALRDFDNHGFFINGATNDNWAIRNCVGYKVGHQTTNHAFVDVAATSGTGWIVTSCTLISNNSSAGVGFFFRDLGGTVSDLRSTCGGGDGFNFDEAGTFTNQTRQWSNLHAHSNGAEGFHFDEAGSIDILNLHSWRNSSQGVRIDGVADLVISGGRQFGNVGTNWFFGAGAFTSGLYRIIGMTIAGDSTFATNRGLEFPTSPRSYPKIRFENCTFGVATGIFVAHSTADIDFTAGNPKFVDITFVYCILASATEFANATASVLPGRSAIRKQSHDQVANAHSIVYPALGTVAYEGTIFRTAAPSEKLTPSGATSSIRLRSAIRRVPCASGVAVVISAYVRKDGSYTGSAARLLVLANPSVGITSDTVIASMAGAADAWEQLTGATAAPTANGVLEFVVEVDGSAGNVYTDDWAAA